MADNPWSVTSSGGGGGSTSNPWAVGGSVPSGGSSGGGGGGGGILGSIEHIANSAAEIPWNFSKDVGHAAVGIVPGTVVLGKDIALDTADKLRHKRGPGHERVFDLAKQLVKSYGDYYGHDVLHHLHEHPLQPLIDALTAYDLGVGGAAKVGKIADIPSLAKLSDRGELVTRSPRKVFQGEGPEIRDLGSTKPSRNLRERGTQKVTRASDTGRLVRSGRPGGLLGVGGELTRYGKHILQATARNALEKMPVYEKYVKAVKPLSQDERTALDMRAEDIHPDDLAEVWQGLPNGEQLTPKIRDLILNPSEKMLKAEPYSRALSRTNARMLKVMGKLRDESEQNRPGLAKREAAKVLGRPVRVLHGEPYYIPHTHLAEDIEKGSSPFGAVGGGKADPRLPRSTKKNRGVLFRQGKVGYGKNAAGLEFLRRVKLITHSERHQALMDASIRHTYDEINSMPGGTIPKGFTYIRPKATSKIPYTIRPEGSEGYVHPGEAARETEDAPEPGRTANGRKELGTGLTSNELARLIPDPGDLQNSALIKDGLTTDDIRDVEPDENGHYHIIPKQTVKAAVGEFTRQGDLLYLFNKYPVRIWRALLLGTRPSFLTNNVIGNSLMYAVKIGGTGALRDLVMSVAEHHGWREAAKLVDDPVTPPALRLQLKSDLARLRLTEGGKLERAEPRDGTVATASPTEIEHSPFGAHEVGDEPVPRQPIADDPEQRFYDKNYPEQREQYGTFLTQAPGAETAIRKIPGKLGGVAKGFTTAIPKLTSYAAEGSLRRGLIRNYIRRSPEFKAVYNALPKEERTFLNAAEKLHKGQGGPVFQRMISKEVDRSLGNYTNLSPVERNVLRSALPFYSWYRAILTSTMHLALDNPVRAWALYQLGQIGEGTVKQLLGGALPQFLEGSIGLGKGPNGTQRLLTTAGINPWATLSQIAAGSGTDITQLGLNPFLEGALESYAKESENGGHASVGGIVKGTLWGTLTGLPTSQLFAPRGPSKLYPNRGRGDQLQRREAAFWAWLGASIKEVDPATAAQDSGKPPPVPAASSSANPWSVG